MITLHVKTPKDKKTVQIEDNAVIKDVSVFSALVSLTENMYIIVALALHAIWSYKERWDFPRAGSSLFLPRFSGLTFLRFLGPFFIFSEIFSM